MAKEVELKLRVNKGVEGVVSQLQACLSEEGLEAEFVSKPLLNIYFDTPERLLNQHKMALRIRKTPDAYVQTLKTKGSSVNGLSQRGEWEWTLQSPELNESVLADLDVWPSGMAVANLLPAFETNFTRHAAMISWQGAEIELAYDQGDVVSGSVSEKINEIELELKSGDVSALTSLSEVLCAAIDLAPFDISKAERGYALSPRR